ncbi:MAG: hypothetical protein N3D82_03620 [Ignisphaera sp.]|nr:hypothetical protein [Ignisphaera sp.]MCX8168095.1 hypothetical protein [Ignisphaera sp.]MDW8085919.1 hypothetical protein [Ignisphaera sp.]
MVVMRQEIAFKKMIEYTARKASLLNQRYEIEDLVAPSVASIVDRSMERIALTLVKRNGGLWCNLCSKGPFTKRGLYLHLIRVHTKDIEFMIKEEMKKILDGFKRDKQ